MFQGRFYTFLNVTIVVCSFIETYVFPIAIIKWIIVITKYGGLVSLLKKCKANNTPLPTAPLKSEYMYSLQLVTSHHSHGRNVGLGVNETNYVSHVCVVIEDNKDCHRCFKLSFCGQDCVKIPPALSNMYGAKVQYLDLSYNSIETLRGLDKFHNLQELILDNNKLGDSVTFPYLPHLRTLSLNNNQLTDLDSVLDKIWKSFPSLTYLSLLSNAACPDQLTDMDKDASDYQRYRYWVLHKLCALRFLDSRAVCGGERAEAAARGRFVRVRRPPPLAPAPAPAVASASALPLDLAALGKHTGAYGKCQYKYTGKHSEGNRFIVNSDL